jgi:hypothetical protein
MKKILDQRVDWGGLIPLATLIVLFVAAMI